MSNEIQHQKDRRRFRQNFQIAKKTEMIMQKQRKELGLPETPRGKDRFNITIFRPHQPRD